MPPYVAEHELNLYKFDEPTNMENSFDDDIDEDIPEDPDLARALGLDDSDGDGEKKSVGYRTAWG